jgi:hypothetical protein
MARSPALLVLLLGLLVQAAAGLFSRPVCGRGSPPPLRCPPLFVVGLRRAGFVKGLPGFGPRLGRTQLGARKRKVSERGERFWVWVGVTEP